MALSSPCYVLAFLFLFLALAISTSSTMHIHHHDHGLKSMHFTLYEHDTLNKTDFLIVEGVSDPDSHASTASPFGSIFVGRDNLTATPDPFSELLGVAEGATFTSSFDGLDNLAIGKFTLNLKGHKGSVSCIGSFNSLRPSTVPVVGGTEDFLLVQGYLIAAIVESKGSNSVIKVEFICIGLLMLTKY